MSTVAAIRQALAALPDTAALIIEDDYGRKYRLLRVYAVGRAFDPGLVLEVRELPVIDAQLGD